MDSGGRIVVAAAAAGQTTLEFGVARFFGDPLSVTPGVSSQTYIEDDGARTETFCGGYLRYDPAPVRRAAHVNDEIECSRDLLAEVRHGKVHIGHQGHGLES